MNVGFIGVGYMGRHMVKHIIKGGNKLTVYDIDSEATQEIQSLGASLAASPKEVAQSSEVIYKLAANLNLLFPKYFCANIYYKKNSKQNF